MKIVRCDICGKTEECPTGLKPREWWERDYTSFQQVGLRVYKLMHQQHACGVECRRALAAQQVNTG